LDELPSHSSTLENLLQQSDFAQAAFTTMVSAFSTSVEHVEPSTFCCPAVLKGHQKCQFFGLESVPPSTNELLLTRFFLFHSTHQSTTIDGTTADTSPLFRQLIFLALRRFV
jgi:hypothetical protein